MISLSFVTGGSRLKHIDEVQQRVQLSMKHIDGWLYGVSTVVSNISGLSFRGLPSHANLTLINAGLESLSYAFPR